MAENERKINTGKDRKKEGTVRFTSGYSDIPLDFGSGQLRDQTGDEPPVPPEIRRMRALAPTGFASASQRELHFYIQGKLMADYEDDYEFRGRFLRYYPTYQTMNVSQLRGYFSWRTRWHALEKILLPESKEPEHPGTSVNSGEQKNLPLPTENDVERFLSFAYLYAYELICGIGTSSPEEGYQKLLLLKRLIGKYDARFRTHLSHWLNDYVVYYNMDSSLIRSGDSDDLNAAMELLSGFEKDCIRESDEKERRQHLLKRHKRPASGFPIDQLPESTAAEEDGRSPEKRAETAQDDHRIFDAIAKLSAKDPKKSPFYKKHPEDLETVIIRSYAEICRFYYRNGKHMLLEQAYGSKGHYPYRLFESAVFYDHLKYKNYEYAADDFRTFRCKNGVWTCERYLISDRKSPMFGQICHEADRLMRDRCSFGHPLRKQLRSTVLSEIITRTVDSFLAEKKEAASPDVHIDLSHLEAIRRDAAHTQDQLIIGEENPLPSAEKNPLFGAEPVSAPGEFPAVPPDAPPSETIKASPEREILPDACDTSSETSILSPVQAGFLRLLLENGNWQEFLNGHPEVLSVSILADSINEALMDEIGDTVIEMDGDTPSVIEDYREDVAALLP